MSGLELRVDLKGGTEVAKRFEKAGDIVRRAIVEVFLGVGDQIARAARAGSPSKRAAPHIKAWVTDGVRGKQYGAIVLRVGTDRRFRWVQQFEYGTVGTGPRAHTGVGEMGVRPHARRYSAGDVYEVIGRNRRRRVAMGVVQVRGYTRHQHMPRHPFMGPAFRAVEPTVVPRIERAVSAALAFEKGGR